MYVSKFYSSKFGPSRDETAVGKKFAKRAPRARLRRPMRKKNLVIRLFCKIFTNYDSRLDIIGWYLFSLRREWWLFRFVNILSRIYNYCDVLVLFFRALRARDGSRLASSLCDICFVRVFFLFLFLLRGNFFPILSSYYFATKTRFVSESNTTPSARSLA